MADEIRRWAEDGLVNIVGSCCGSTPEHTRAIAAAVRGMPPRPLPQPARRRLRLAGLEAVEVGA